MTRSRRSGPQQRPGPSGLMRSDGYCRGASTESARRPQDQVVQPRLTDDRLLTGLAGRTNRSLSPVTSQRRRLATLLALQPNVSFCSRLRQLPVSSTRIADGPRPAAHGPKGHHHPRAWAITSSRAACVRRCYPGSTLRGSAPLSHHRARARADLCGACPTAEGAWPDGTGEDAWRTRAPSDHRRFPRVSGKRRSESRGKPPNKPPKR